MLKKENIFIKNFETKDDVFKFIANDLSKKYSIKDSEVLDKLLERERQVSTGFEDGIAIPHAQIKGIVEPILYVIKTKDIVWPALDKKGTNFIICILVPENAGKEHLKILSNLTRNLAEDNFRSSLKNSNESEIVKLINGTVLKEEVEQSFIDDGDFYVAVTKCPVGIAHTYLAAEKLEKAAKELEVNIKVETQGSAGIENTITSDDVKRAKGVIICADAAIEKKGRFSGKKVIETPIKNALDNPKGLFEMVNDAKELIINEEIIDESSDTTVMKAIMNGVSHMIPFVVVGGLLIALSLSLGGDPTPDGLVIPADSFWLKLNQIGVFGFTLMIPILAGYIAYAIAGRAALAPAMIGAMIANDPGILGTDAGTGFLGALVVGLMAGYLVKWMNSWKIPKEIRAIMPIFVIPILGSLAIGFVFIIILAKPIALIMLALNSTLTFLASNPYLQVVLGFTLGAMIAVDMGGPVNKVAFLFGVASITSGAPEIMGAVAAAIAVPPLAMGVATLIRPNKFSEEEKGAGVASLLMGFIGITEGAIPFAAGDPKRVIPSIIIGSGVASTLALMFNVTNMVPHGGPIVGVLGGTTNTGLYFLSITIGVIVAAFLVVTLKKTPK